MTTKDKVWRYLSGHKRAVTAQFLSDYFIQSKSTIIKVLNELKNQGKLEVVLATDTKSGRRPYAWRLKRVGCMAFSELDDAPPAPPAPRQPAYNRPMQNSYPSVRGYED